MFPIFTTKLKNNLITRNSFSFVMKNLIISKNNILLLKNQRSNFSSVYVNHRDTIDNNQDSPFDFTEENYNKVQEILVIIYFINNYLKIKV
jgi:hypothetical protein